MNDRSPLCSVSELRSLIEQKHVTILDSSWYLPSQNIDSRQEYEAQHIPTAQFFHIDLVCDQNSALPHMLPSADLFSQAVSELGASNDSHIVVYDSAGLFSAARVWWTFKVFGHHNIKVLDGGLPAWIKAGGELESHVQPSIKTDYKATLNNDLVSNKAELVENANTKQYVILDARPKQRFLGLAPEPRPGLPSGHMPESISFSYANLISEGRLKPAKQLQSLFRRANVDSSTKVVSSCGSGVTAAIITLALAECGYGLHKLYDGSWAEWGADGDTTILDRSF